LFFNFSQEILHADTESDHYLVTLNRHQNTFVSEEALGYKSANDGFTLFRLSMPVTPMISLRPLLRDFDLDRLGVDGSSSETPEPCFDNTPAGEMGRDAVDAVPSGSGTKRTPAPVDDDVAVTEGRLFGDIGGRSTSL
jgi:hypothetical protein